MRVLLPLLLVLGACASKRVMTNNVQKSSQIGLQSELLWVKFKRKKMDFMVRFTGQGEIPVLLEPNAFQAQVEGVKSTGAINPNFREIIRDGDVVDVLVTLRQANLPLKRGAGKIIIRHLFSYKGDRKSKALQPLVHSFNYGARQ